MSDGDEDKKMGRDDRPEPALPPWERKEEGYKQIIELQEGHIGNLEKKIEEYKDLVDAQKGRIENAKEIIVQQKKILAIQKKRLDQYAKPVENLEEEFTVNKEDIRFADIGGLDPVLNLVRRFEWGILYPKMYQAYAKRPPKGLMLYGPPGCGKTMIAKAMSYELSAYFYELPTTRFMSEYVSRAERTLEQILVRCNEIGKEHKTKVIIFLDEAETALSKRGNTKGHNVNERVVNTFLRYMDGFGDSEGLIFVGATNRLDLIDEAALRAGRFDYKVEIPRPDRKGVEEILRKQIDYRHRQGGWEIYQIQDYGKLADELYKQGATGADIAAVLGAPADAYIDMFAQMAPEDDVTIEMARITQSDIVDAIAIHRFGNTRASKMIRGFGR